MSSSRLYPAAIQATGARGEGPPVSQLHAWPNMENRVDDVTGAQLRRRGDRASGGSYTDCRQAIGCRRLSVQQHGGELFLEAYIKAEGSLSVITGCTGRTWGAEALWGKTTKSNTELWTHRKKCMSIKRQGDKEMLSFSSLRFFFEAQHLKPCGFPVVMPAWRARMQSKGELSSSSCVTLSFWFYYLFFSPIAKK